MLHYKNSGDWTNAAHAKADKEGEPWEPIRDAHCAANDEKIRTNQENARLSINWRRIVKTDPQQAGNGAADVNNQQIPSNLSELPLSKREFFRRLAELDGNRTPGKGKNKDGTGTGNKGNGSGNNGKGGKDKGKGGAGNRAGDSSEKLDQTKQEGAPGAGAPKAEALDPAAAAAAAAGAAAAAEETETETPTGLFLEVTVDMLLSVVSPYWERAKPDVQHEFLARLRACQAKPTGSEPAKPRKQPITPVLGNEPSDLFSNLDPDQLPKPLPMEPEDDDPVVATGEKELLRKLGTDRGTFQAIMKASNRPAWPEERTNNEWVWRKSFFDPVKAAVDEELRKRQQPTG